MTYIDYDTYLRKIFQSARIIKFKFFFLNVSELIETNGKEIFVILIL